MKTDMSSFPHLVSIYIPCHNYGRFLEQTVESVFGQLHPNWELFIVDEGSQDDTAEIAERLRQRDPLRITLIRNHAPVGLQRIANSILGLANGKYIMRLDADDWLDEGALLLMVAKLESDEEFGLVYGNYYYTDAEGNVLGTERRHKFGVEDRSGHVPPHVACTMVRTRLLKSVGGYSEDINAQDGWELWFKLINRTKAASLDAPLFYYRQHTTSLSRDSKRLLDARARIFHQAQQRNKGSYQPSCLAVIPAREAYPSWDKIPYREFEGKSLLQHALESALQASGVTAVAISAEQPSVLQFAEHLVSQQLVADHVRLMRPEALRGSDFPVRDILLHAAEAYQQTHQQLPDILLFLSLHAPLRRAAHVDNAVDVLLTTAADSVVSVTEESEPMFAHGRLGLQLLNPGRFQQLVYERERLFRFNGAVLGVWTEVLLAGSLFGDSIASIEMSKEDSEQVKGRQDWAALLARLSA